MIFGPPSTMKLRSSLSWGLCPSPVWVRVESHHRCYRRWMLLAIYSTFTMYIHESIETSWWEYVIWEEMNKKEWEHDSKKWRQGPRGGWKKHITEISETKKDEVSETIKDLENKATTKFRRILIFFTNSM